MAPSILSAPVATRNPLINDQAQFEREVRMQLRLQLLRPMTADERQLLAAAAAAAATKK